MSTQESDQPLRVPHPADQVGRDLAELRRQAKEACQRLEEAWWRRKVWIDVELTEGHQLSLQFSRALPGFDWKINYDQVPARCESCQREIKDALLKLEGLGEEDLAKWMFDAGIIVHKHGCLVRAASATEEQGESTNQVPSSSELPEPPGPRVRVLVTGAGGGKDSGGAGSHAAPDTSRVIKLPGAASSIKVNSPSAARQVEERARGRYEQCSLSFTYPLASGSQVTVTIPLSICEALIEHCRKSNQHGREVGGVLIGTKDEERQTKLTRYQVGIVDLIQFKASDSSGSHLHLDPESWKYVQGEFEARRCELGKNVWLGWYHTHPTQGIFFSTQDCDFHTSFRESHQFALVVDPRSMEAGLFYWENHEQRSLLGPLCFTLRVLPDEAAVEPGREEPWARAPRGHLAWWRSGLFLIAAAAVAYDIYVQAPGLGGLDPAQASILAALTVLLWFRLWNVGWFHPRDPVEMEVAAEMREVASEMARAIGRALSDWYNRCSPKFKRSVILGVVLLVVALCWNLWRLPPPEPPAPLTRESPSPSNASTQASPRPPVTISVRDASTSLQQRLILAGREGDHEVKVEYRLQDGWGGDDWKCDPENEAKFFRQLFQWEIRGGPQTYLQELQQQLYAQGATATDVADGSWGKRVRHVFLKKAQELQYSGKHLEVSLPDGSPMQVLFKSQEGN